MLRGVVHKSVTVPGGIHIQSGSISIRGIINRSMMIRGILNTSIIIRGTFHMNILKAGCRHLFRLQTRMARHHATKPILGHDHIKLRSAHCAAQSRGVLDGELLSELMLYNFRFMEESAGLMF